MPKKKKKSLIKNKNPIAKKVIAKKNIKNKIKKENNKDSIKFAKKDKIELGIIVFGTALIALLIISIS